MVNDYTWFNLRAGIDIDLHLELYALTRVDENSFRMVIISIWSAFACAEF